MTHTPKHRGEPVVKYQITVIERERGWGQTDWTEEFDTPELAQARIDFINSYNTQVSAPDYYMQAEQNIKKITL